MIDTAALDLLEGGGKSAKFEVGTVVKGKVVSAEARQQTSFESKEPLFWDDGNPRMQLVITLATDERDADDPTDDGHRNLYCRGQLLNALKAALKAANAKLAEGGDLAVKCTGLGDPPKPHLNPPKLYVAEYSAPSKVTGAESLLGDVQAPAAEQATPTGGLL